MQSPITLNYYPFGMVMPGRSFTSESYRYGFNGMEKSDEIAQGNYTTPFRELDSRLGGRWWSPDPIVKPWESPYAGFSNNPIVYSDPSGLDPETDRDRETSRSAAHSSDSNREVKFSAGILDEATVTASKSPSSGNSGNWSSEVNYSNVAPEDRKTIKGCGGKCQGKTSQMMNDLLDISTVAIGAPLILSQGEVWIPMLVDGAIEKISHSFIGGTIDYSAQVAVNYATGSESPWTDVNLTSVGMSALNPNGGLLTTARNAFFSSAFQFNLSTGKSENILNGKQDLKGVMISTGVSIGLRYGFGKFTNKLSLQTSKGLEKISNTQNYMLLHGLDPTTGSSNLFSGSLLFSKGLSSSYATKFYTKSSKSLFNKLKNGE